MRKGQNVAKDKPVTYSKSYHRIIIPLYIPNETGYYKDAYEIFLLCLQSLRKTSINILQISVCSNGCCDEVNKKLVELYTTKVIDELFIERVTIGKINSILKALRTAEEPFITITDADVLFLNDWEKSIFKVYESFPKAAAVSPLPVFRTQNHYTSNLLFDYFFSNKLKFRTVKNPEALTRFAKSIGWPWLDTKWKDVIMTVEGRNLVKAIVGCNHCVVTYKKEIFEAMPNGNSKFVLGGNSEALYLDKLSQFYDGYRLSTYDNFAYHLGNKIEDWMLQEFKLLKGEQKLDYTIITNTLTKSYFKNLLKNIFFKKIINNKFIRIHFYKWKGLTNEQIKNFVN